MANDASSSLTLFLHSVRSRLMQPWAAAQEVIRAVLNASPGQVFATLLLLLMTYSILVSRFRFQRMRSLQKKYNYPTRESMANMTDDQAWEIQKVLSQLEFPFLYTKALQFALFRTYGIPSISGLLTSTAQFSKPGTSLKRYSDTAVLIQEFIGNAPSSRRACTALARTRWLHSGYRASGKILEDDMLYTLSLFAVCPLRFMEMYEWRSLTDLEKCAMGTFWKSVGDGLGISFEKLPSGKKGGQFKDGIQWLDEVMNWSDAYEAEKMIPDLKNRETADQTTAVLVYMLPKPLKHIGYKFVSFMMDDRLRKAMLYEPPPPSYANLFSTLLAIRRFIMRYLALPRPYFLRITTFTEEPDKNGRLFLTKWDAAPYYVKPTFWNRWGPTAWLTWLLGKPLPGDERHKFYPTGYYIPDVGPKYFEGKGRGDLTKIMEEMKSYRTGECPF